VFAKFKKSRMSCYSFHFGLFIKLINIVRRRPKLQGTILCSDSVDAIIVRILSGLSSGLNLFNFMEKD
jgi:hypothetical protein